MGIFPQSPFDFVCFPTDANPGEQVSLSFTGSTSVMSRSSSRDGTWAMASLVAAADTAALPMASSLSRVPPSARAVHVVPLQRNDQSPAGPLYRCIESPPPFSHPRIPVHSAFPQRCLSWILGLIRPQFGTPCPAERVTNLLHLGTSRGGAVEPRVIYLGHGYLGDHRGGAIGRRTAGAGTVHTPKTSFSCTSHFRARAWPSMAPSPAHFLTPGPGTPPHCSPSLGGKRCCGVGLRNGPLTLGALGA